MSIASEPSLRLTTLSKGGLAYQKSAQGSLGSMSKGSNEPTVKSGSKRRDSRRPSEISVGPSHANGVIDALGADTSNGNGQPVALRMSELNADYAKFLVTYTSALLDRTDRNREFSEGSSKPQLEIRSFKPHTMDNVRVRKLCDVSAISLPNLYIFCRPIIKSKETIGQSFDLFTTANPNN